MSWKATLKHALPPRLLNETLLRMPSLYRTSFVNYESNLDEDGFRDLEDLLGGLPAIPGDLIECGSSRCGTAIILALRLWSRGIQKMVHACDSFQGFDLDELQRERELGLTTDNEQACASTSYNYVKRKLQVLGLAERVHLVRGYFQQTLPNLPGPFCFALIDCDLRPSMAFCARALFEKLSPGAWIAFDDYMFEPIKGARLAVDEFVRDFGSCLTEVGLRRRLFTARRKC